MFSILFRELLNACVNAIYNINKILLQILSYFYCFSFYSDLIKYSVVFDFPTLRNAGIFSYKFA